MTTTTTTTQARGAVGDWRHRAACGDVDPELFYPAADSGPVFEAQVAEAKTVCAGCLVRAQCLVFALAALPYGIAGGLTPAERRRHRTSRPRGSGAVPVADDGPPAGASRPEVAAAGRAAIRAGRPAREVAREFGVSERTAERWATQAHDTTSNDTTSAGTGAKQGRGAA